MSKNRFHNIIVCFTLSIICSACGSSGGGDTGASSSDQTPPTIISTTPTNGSIDIGLNTAISITFSEAMEPSAITTSTITVSGGVTGTVSLSTDGKTAVFTPSSLLSLNTPYTVTVSTGVKDLAGNPMLSTYSWSFTSGTPSNLLSWDAPTTWADSSTLSASDIGGYKVYYGTSSGTYTNSIDVGKVTTYILTGLPNGTYYIAVTAYDLNGIESDYSNEGIKAVQ